MPTNRKIVNFLAALWIAVRRCSVVVTLAGLWHARTIAEEPDKVLFQQHLPKVPAHVMAEVTLLGKPCIMILDTGAGIVTLDKSLTKAILSNIGETNVMLADGSTQTMTIFEGASLKLDQLSIDRPAITFSDLGRYSLYTGRPLSGVIGMNALSVGKIFMSHDEGIFQVHIGPWKLDKFDCQEIELEKDSPAAVIKTDILGHSAKFTVDTGMDDCIRLEAEVFDALVKEGAIEPAKVNARTLSLTGMTSSTRGWFLKGELMGKKLAGVTVVSNAKASILGLAWLYGFNMEIDFTKRKLRYQLRRDAKLPGSVAMTLGAILLYEGSGAQIERLRPSGGAAEDAGLKPGDVIEKFGDIKAGAMNAAVMGEAVADAAGKEVAVRFLRKSDGERVNTKLKLPPNISEWNFSGRERSNEK